MSGTTTNLFTLAENADAMSVGLVNAESFGIDNYFGADKPRVLRVVFSDGEAFHFPDQQVTLVNHGEALASDCDEDCVMNVGRNYRLHFFIARAMTAADLLPAVQ